MTNKRPLSYLGINEINPPDMTLANRAPTTADLNYDLGDMWINKTTSITYQLVSKAAGSATWTIITPGASDVDTINGLAPAGGNIVIAGGTNLTDVNGGNTVTLNLDNAITLATSVTSPIYTSVAGMAINAPAGNDITIKMGDAAGANKVSFVDSATVEVFAVDSNGALSSSTGLTVAGNFAQTAGTFNVGQDNAANAISIGGGTTARAIDIGDSAAPHIVTLGSSDTTAQTIVQSGTVGLSQTSTGPITIDAAGVLELNSSAGVIGIGNDAVAQNINVGTGGAARVITVGNITGATAVNINTGTGGTALTTTNGVVGIITGTGAINIGADAAQKTITVGNATGASSVVVNGGTGAMQFGANAIAHDTTLGSLTGANTTTIQSGSTGFVQTSTGPMTLDSAGVLELNSSAGIIGIGNDAVNQNMNIGTAGVRTVTVGSPTGASSTVVQSGTGAASFAANATDHTTTIGSTTGVSATVIQGGTGKITVTGTIKEATTDYMTRTGDSITFYASPIVQSALNTGVAPTGATGDVNIVACREGVFMEEYVIGAGQTIIAPRMNANGLLVSGDLTVGEGYEYNFGAARSNSRHAFTIGTSPAFQFELRFRINDMDGADPYIFGFRKVEANNAVFTNYTDYATIGMIASSSTTKIVTATELNSAGTTITDTTDLWGGDGTTNTLTVKVSAAGVVTYLINGLAPTASAAFTFDNGDIVVPFIRIKHSASPTEVNLVSMKIGYQS